MRRPRVAVIGLGLVGGSLARRLVQRGYDVTGIDWPLVVRQALRARANISVSLREYRGSGWDGTCVEISLSGMKVRTPASLAIGTAVQCGFALPDGGEPIDVISIVVRHDPTGTVLSFVNLPAHEQRRLGELIRTTSR